MSETTTYAPAGFRAARYRFDIQAVDTLHLPVYKGSTLRGGFGYAFKKMVCVNDSWRACTPCQLGNACPYGYIFETSPPADSANLSKLQDVPVPFVIEPPLEDETTYAPGDRLGFETLLVGRAINYLPYFILAYEELGRTGIGRPRSQYVLQRISSVHPWHSTSELIYDGVDVRVGGRDLSVTMSDVAERAAALPADRLTLRFTTPVKMKYRGRFVHRPEFHVLVRNLLRRISSLAYFHCGELWETDFRGIIQAAEQIELVDTDVAWVTWDRFSGRQQQRIDMSGFAGQAAYRGDLAPLRPLVALGELVHVGKATVFGYGQYRIEAA